MNMLIDDILALLESNGFECSVQIRHGLDVICTTSPDGHHDKVILPLAVKATNPEEAERLSKEAEESIRMINSYDGEYPLIITQDRWITQREMMQKRLLSHLEVFSPIYARNCEIRRIDKSLAREFLERTHSYGHAACRYCYGMFFKRHTGHIAEFMQKSAFIDQQDTADRICTQDEAKSGFTSGDLVAVATFSNARKWIKEGQTIRSYEWTRYACLPETRISGGMGRFIKHFIKEIEPDDIMTYSDLEWSKGDVYMRLGFCLEGKKDPVMFAINDHWERIPIKRLHQNIHMQEHLYFRNFGSNKFRLKLTDYK